VARGALYLSPLWSGAPHPAWRLAGELLLDAVREPLDLYPVIADSYWRAGLGRWFRTFRRYHDEIGAMPLLSAPYQVMAGAADPLVDRERILKLDPEADIALPGAHAMHFSDPEATAERIDRFIRTLPA